MKNLKLSLVMMTLLTVQTMAEPKQSRTWQQAAYDNRYGIAAGAATVGIGALGYAYSDEIAEFLKLAPDEQQKSIQDDLQNIQKEQSEIYTKEQILAEEIRLAKEQRVAEIARFEEEKIRLKKEVQRAEEQRQVEVSRLEQEKSELEAKNTADFYTNVGIGVGGMLVGGTAVALNESQKQKIEKERLAIEKERLAQAAQEAKKTHVKEKSIMRQLHHEEQSNLHNELESVNKKIEELSIKNKKYELANQAKSNTPKIEVERVQLACDAEGYPTITAIKELMKKEYFSDITSSKLTVTIINTGNFNGNFSDRIYCVSIDTKPVFFLKISTYVQQESIQNKLTAIQESHIGRIAIGKQYAKALRLDIHKSLPIITWIEKFFVYINPSGSQVIIEMCHAAKGKQINDILSNGDLESQKKCMAAIGKSLASLQTLFMNYYKSDDPGVWRTVAHNDFHVGNIFYDNAKNQVYLIDNERMNDNQPIISDLHKMLQILDICYPQNAQTLTSSFLTSYVNAFPEMQQKALLKSKYFTVAP